MPSYLEKEQLIQVPPFIANTSAILNTFNTRLQYWAAGAARIKSAYDKYLGLDLTRESNQSKLKEFMAGAKEQMKKTVQTDLSVGDNQVQALNIFDPLVNGQTDFSKNILGDNAVTSHYKSQLTTAESYRTRDNGKNYSDTNVAYLTQHLGDFRDEKSDDSWQKYYNNRRFYTPYHDYVSEIREIMQGYKPNHQLKKVPTGSLYFHEIEDESTTKADALRYINANLSDKARQQMKIEGAVSFHGRDEDLIKSVTADWQADIAKYNSYSKSLEAEIRLEKNPERKAQLESERVLLNRRVGNIQSNFDKFRQGDLSEILDNKESYANKLYSNNLLDAISTGYVRTDYQEKYSPDQAAISQMNETGRNMRHSMSISASARENQLDRESAERIAAIRAEGKLKDAPGSATFAIPNFGDTQSSINLTEEEKRQFSLTPGTIDAEVFQENKNQQEIFGLLHDRLVSAGKINKVDDVEMRTKVVQTYLKGIDATYSDLASKVQDPRTLRGLMEKEFFPGVMETVDALRETNQKIYSASAVKEKIYESALPQVQSMYKNGNLDIAYADKNGPTNRVVIDPKTAMNFVFKGDRSKIQEKTTYTEFPNLSQDGGMGIHTETKYFYNGRELDKEAVEQMKKQVNEITTKSYDTKVVENMPIWKIGPNSKVKLDVAKKTILENVTHKDKELKEADFQILGYAEDGRIFFKGDGKIEGAKKKTEDVDGRYIYELPTEDFKIDVNAAIPANAKGLKYFFDKQIPFLTPGKTLSTPADKNFFQAGDVRYRVEAQKDQLGTTTYNLYNQETGGFLSSFPDFFSMVQYANTYPLVKSQIK